MAQENHVARYHDAIADQRNKLLRSMGVDPDVPWTVEQVLMKLEEHLCKRYVRSSISSERPHHLTYSQQSTAGSVEFQQAASP